MTAPGTSLGLWTVAAGATVIGMWASSFVAVTVALRDLSPAQVALSRYAVAGLVFIPIMLWRRTAMPRRGDLLRLAGAGFVGFTMYNLALNAGQQTVGPGVASLLVNTVPIWTALLALALLGERLEARGWVGTGISFLGVSIIGLEGGGWSGFDAGVLLILTAAFAQAVYFVLIAPLLERYHPLEVTAWCVWFGLAFLFPFGRGMISALRESTPMTLTAVVFLGVGPAALAYVAWSYVLAEVPAGSAAGVLFLVPPAAIAIGWFVLRDVPSVVSLVGGMTSVVGVVISKRIGSR